MSDHTVFPFERNRYYAGKMLSSADFTAEQAYMNHKRSFLNNLMFGSGVVCGCNVYNLDDLSVFIESGCAIDSLGREIVIDASVVKKLSAIEGFDQMESDRLTLCLRYKEENAHPVYSVKRESADAEYEYNRIREGYELFLMETAKVAPFIQKTEFFAKGFLHKGEDYEIFVQLPATVCKERYVKMQVTARKLSDSAEPFSYKGILQTPSFVNKEGRHEQEIEFQGLALSKGESATLEYWMFAQDVAVKESVLILKGDPEHSEENSFSMKVLLSDMQPAELADREIGKMNLEMQEFLNAQDYICLAQINLIRTDSAYIIDGITERGVKNYIEVPAKGAKRREYLDYFRGKEIAGAPDTEWKEAGGEAEPDYRIENGLLTATGTLEIPIGGRAKAGSVFYSGEIMHGLGPGLVYVEIGREFIEDDAALGANVKSVVYGNEGLFEESAGKNPKTKTAVKALNDKGSFLAAVKFESEADCLALTYRWVAVKFSGDREQNASASGQWIEAETPTAVLGAREDHYFGVKFHNMEKCSIAYEVTEENGGTITMDGVYTAPGKEGVYEIKIFCLEQPLICAYAYAVVRKKKS